MKTIKNHKQSFEFLDEGVSGAVELEIVRQFREWKEKQPYPFALPNQKIILPTPEGWRFIEFENIVYLQAEGSYTYFYLTGGEKMVISAILKEFDTRLKQPPFVRTHRSFIVNLNHIAKYMKGRRGSLVMTNGHKVEISVRKRERFERIIEAYFY